MYVCMHVCMCICEFGREASCNAHFYGMYTYTQLAICLDARMCR